MRDGEYQIARPDATGPQRQFQSIRAIGHADGMTDPYIGGKRPLKGLHLFPQDVPAAIQNTLDGSINPGFVSQVACSGVCLRNWRRLAHG